MNIEIKRVPLLNEIVHDSIWRKKKLTIERNLQIAKISDEWERKRKRFQQKQQPHGEQMKIADIIYKYLKLFWFVFFCFDFVEYSVSFFFVCLLFPLFCWRYAV